MALFGVFWLEIKDQNSNTKSDQAHSQLWDKIDRFLDSKQLILISNRGPIEYHLESDGSLKPYRGSGGVVTALSGLTSRVNFTWIASAIGDGDRKIAQNQNSAIHSPLQDQNVSVRYIVSSRRTYHKYYNIICNPLLWFLQHYMWSSAYTPRVDSHVYDAWENGYISVNQQFADAAIEEADPKAPQLLVMIHDYQLYLVPGMIRSRLPGALIHQFIHIPWPSSSYWLLLPEVMRRSICSSLCHADIVGFQTSRDVRAFLESVEAFLPEAEVDHQKRAIVFDGNETLVKSYPISIDVEEVRRIAASPRAKDYDHFIRPLLGEKTIVRVDRAEPSKNIVRGFQAYDLLLERYPELRGTVKFLAFLVPSRTHIRQYERYLNDIHLLVDTINEKYSTGHWRPIEVYYENNYTQAIAAMKLYDVLLVNSVIDGMNLVAKEGPIVNTKNGVLILSEAAGAHEQLQPGCLSIAPADIEGTVRTLHQALTMNHKERKQRSKELVGSIEREDIAHWLQEQLADIGTLPQ